MLGLNFVDFVVIVLLSLICSLSMELVSPPRDKPISKNLPLDWILSFFFFMAFFFPVVGIISNYVKN